MKTTRLPAFLAGLVLVALSSFAQALDIKPYSATALSEAQAAGRPVAVHFHADWCPTCRAQAEAFKSLMDDPQLKPVTLLVANYDTEQALKQTLKVRAQSTLVVFKGGRETARVGGDTQAAKLKSALATAL